MENFDLDPRLQNDTLLVGDLPLCRVLLMNDQRYPWIVLVPRRSSMVEIIDLAVEDRSRLYEESEQVSQLLLTHFAGDKLNVGALGNVVSQLHVHHVLRHQGDPAWPGPVWGHSPAEPYAADVAERRVVELQRLLSLS